MALKSLGVVTLVAALGLHKPKTVLYLASVSWRGLQKAVLLACLKWGTRMELSF